MISFFAAAAPMTIGRRNRNLTLRSFITNTIARRAARSFSPMNSSEKGIIFKLWNIDYRMKMKVVFSIKLKILIYFLANCTSSNRYTYECF